MPGLFISPPWPPVADALATNLTFNIQLVSKWTFV
jgi:hypothetical protein